MRTFIVVCLIALATGDKLGYNYKPVDRDDGNYGRGESNLSGPIGDAGDIGGGIGSLGGLEGGSADLGGNGGGYEKEFYTFKANENEFGQPDASQQIANSLKKNLKVVFIKGPENSGLEDAALALAKHASEQKTAIYVLNKQVDIGELAKKLNAANSQNHNKPEVHFVKYRTPEDAQNAQHQIQNQYGALGGPSQSHDGGIAPVLDFASKGGIGGGRDNIGGNIGGGNIGGGNIGGGSIGGGNIGGGSIGGGSLGGGYESSRVGTYLPPLVLFR